MYQKNMTGIVIILLTISLGSLACADTLTSKESDADFKRSFSFKTIKKIVFNSFGLDAEKMAGATQEVSDAFNKRSDAMSDSVDKTEKLQADMAERQRLMDLQIYGDESQ